MYVEVNTYEFRPYLLSCCITPSRGCIFYHFILSTAALSHRKNPAAGTSCGRWHAEGSDKRGPLHLTYEILWKTYFLCIDRSFFFFFKCHTQRRMCACGEIKYISVEDVS